MPKVGDLFFELGVTGSAKGKGQVKEFRDGVKDTAAASLQMKAAVIGAFYALQQLFSASGNVGTGLKTFTSLMGTSAETLQRYQYAARKVGVSNDEVEKSFLSLRDTFGKITRGEGAPSGLAMIAEAVGDIDMKDVLKWSEDPEEFFQKLQIAAKKMPKGMFYASARSFGLSDGMIAAVQQQAFQLDILKKATNVYSKGEIDALAKAQAAWVELGETIQKAIGRFNAKHGGDIVANISKMVSSVVELSEALVVLSDKIKLFEKMNAVVRETATLIKDVAKAIEDPSAKNIKSILLKGNGETEEADSPKAQLRRMEAENKGRLPVREERTEAGQYVLELMSVLLSAMTGDRRFFDSTMKPNAGDKRINAEDLIHNLSEYSKTENSIPKRGLKYLNDATVPASRDGYSPKTREGMPDLGSQSIPQMLEYITVPVMRPDNVARPVLPAASAAGSQGASNGPTQIQIDQTLNFQHPGVDPNRTADSVKQASKSAWQQSSARVWGS
jgi:hypothetical protein